ncbi:MAG: hypothetical protein MJE68_26970 [Proteobacteria bacterium]|nr:hypothetical protein [Pseudomonadota bacterium]
MREGGKGERETERERENESGREGERERVGGREETERLCGSSGIVPLYVVSRSHFD